MEKKRYEVVKRFLRIYPAPEEYVHNGLVMKFKPSKYWTKKYGKIMEPIIHTDLIRGQHDYKLPPYFNAKTVEMVKF